MERFVLLDRDGVINQRIGGGYVTSLDQFTFLPGALEGLTLLARHQVSALVVSNQACVGKGLLTQEGLDGITRTFMRQIEEHGGRIRAVYYCTHRAEDECDCRKPKPGLILKAQRDYGFRLQETYVIGDSVVDWEAAAAAGCPPLMIADDETVPVLNGGGSPPPIFPNLYRAVQYLLSEQK